MSETSGLKVVNIFMSIVLKTKLITYLLQLFFVNNKDLYFLSHAYGDFNIENIFNKSHMGKAGVQD